MSENVNMSERVKEVRRAYYRKYRAEHPEKIKEINKRYWEKKAAQALLTQEEK